MVPDYITKRQVKWRIVLTSFASFRFLLSPAFLSMLCWKSYNFLPNIVKGTPVKLIFAPWVSRGSSQSILCFFFSNDLLTSGRGKNKRSENLEKGCVHFMMYITVSCGGAKNISGRYSFIHNDWDVSSKMLQTSKAARTNREARW